MEKLYEEESNKFIELLKKYVTDNAKIEDLLEQERVLNVAHSFADIDSFKKIRKEKLFNFYNSLYKKLLIKDKKLKEIKEILQTKDHETEVDLLIKKSQLISRVTKAPDFGFENSSFKWPPFPSQQMMNRNNK
ncbi:hypothetical protein TCON_1100 [Astathelohania contejeani]|uniref:Uncharacterized protein n=1 Tax=Astathelohania contejeani TaxID=164912 RepID=A0ABQ7HZX2_9MICR|nr:hypothetical protein TCON_1100 [Thelohania contejeani]